MPNLAMSTLAKLTFTNYLIQESGNMLKTYQSIKNKSNLVYCGKVSTGLLTAVLLGLAPGRRQKGSESCIWEGLSNTFSKRIWGVDFRYSRKVSEDWIYKYFWKYLVSPAWEGQFCPSNKNFCGPMKSKAQNFMKNTPVALMTWG